MRSTHAMFVAVIVGITATSEAMAQQDTSWRWSVASGPTVALRNSRLFQPGSDGTQFTQSEPIVRGAEHGIFHFALGARRAIPKSSLLLRGELLYNRSTSAPRPWLAAAPLWYPRPALRDEAYLISTGLEWDALPTKSLSPYLLTTVGFVHSRLGWSRDAASNRVTETAVSNGLFAGYGAGLRIRVGQREYFTEWRRHQNMFTTYGSNIAPFSVGIRF